MEDRPGGGWPGSEQTLLSVEPAGSLVESHGPSEHTTGDNHALKLEGRSHAHTVTNSAASLRRPQPRVQRLSDRARLCGPRCPLGSSSGMGPLRLAPRMRGKSPGAERKHPLYVRLLFGAGDPTSSLGCTAYRGPACVLRTGRQGPPALLPVPHHSGREAVPKLLCPELTKVL